ESTPRAVVARRNRGRRGGVNGRGPAPGRVPALGGSGYEQDTLEERAGRNGLWLRLQRSSASADRRRRSPDGGQAGRPACRQAGGAGRQDRERRAPPGQALSLAAF